MLVLFVKRIAALAFLFFLVNSNSPAFSASPPVRIGQCSNSYIKSISARFDAAEGQFGSEDSILEFTNGLGGLYLHKSWIKEDDGAVMSGAISLRGAKSLFVQGDSVKVCLQYLPTDCPSRSRLGDTRGEVYHILNYKNSHYAYGHRGRNMCGGA